MLRGKDWVELYFAREMSTILKTMKDLIEFERKKTRIYDMIIN